MVDSPAPRPPTTLELLWEHGLVLSGKSAEARMTLDSEGVEGPSPVQALAFALAGCMAMDVVHILQKGRHDLRGLRTDLTGIRADDSPRRFTSIQLHFTITGVVPPDQIERAIALSRDKYCSVWHSMRQDIAFESTFSVSTGL
jgi:putative redox protein